jgi:Uma2 family endonuclease
MNLIPARPLPLRDGDRLTQAEFHRRYELCPEDVKAELIGGVVYMASPEGFSHSAHHPQLTGLFVIYQAATPGVEALSNHTTVLGETSEPQPDLQLRILTEYGGRSRLEPIGRNQYVHGAPELLVEVSFSSVRLDLNQKLEDYQEAGALEYLVVDLPAERLHWFHFPDQTEITPTRQGIWKSRVFPGLWVDGPALLALEVTTLLETGRKGLASRPHAAFVKRLAAARNRGGS